MRRAVWIACIAVVVIACVVLLLQRGSGRPEPASDFEPGDAVAEPGPTGDKEPVTGGSETPTAGTSDETPKGPVMFDVPDETSTEGDHKITIARQYESEEEARLIQMAESVYPNREDVLAVEGHFLKDKSIPAGEELWWYDAFDGVRVPYAITGDAVRYYRDLTLAFRKGDLAGSNGIRMLKSELHYAAAVARHEHYKSGGREFRDVSVVTMKLSWSQYCGGECAMSFHQKGRIVVFDAAGKIVAVLLDGVTPFAVS